MSKKVISLTLIIITLSLIIFGCNQNEADYNRKVIIDNVIKIEALLPDNDTAELMASGISFANSLADSVKLNEEIPIVFSITKYGVNDNLSEIAKEISDNGVSAIIYGGDDYSAFSSFTAFLDSAEIPVISLCPYEYKSDNFFSLSLTPKYLSSCVATYAKDTGVKNPLVIFETTNNYYVDFAETIKSTFLSYTGIEPSLIYKSGMENYSAYTEHDFVFLSTAENNYGDLISDLRAKGFTSEIMLNEIYNKNIVANELFNNCSLINKFEVDPGNNISTVFTTMYSEHHGINKDEVSTAAAYGYDAYMLTYEALKSFEPKDNLLFGNVTTNETSETAITNSDDILISDYLKAISEVNFRGVTDTIAFNNNTIIPTHIYVDNVIGDKVLFGKKYTFASNS